MNPGTAAAEGLACCRNCCKISPEHTQTCPRCGRTLYLRKFHSLQRTTALLIAASILYIPANLYPIMITDQVGGPIDSTIIGGVVLLIQLGSLPIALVIFVASVMVPLAKIAALTYLVWSVHNRTQVGHRQRTRLYLIAEFVGKWSMVDVFVVAILVALIQLSGLLVIYPGVATYSFAAVVLITMFAAQCFDTRLMWDKLEEENVTGKT